MIKWLPFSLIFHRIGVVQTPSLYHATMRAVTPMRGLIMVIVL
jgi:hypothetical protein